MENSELIKEFFRLKGNVWSVLFMAWWFHWNLTLKFWRKRFGPFSTSMWNCKYIAHDSNK